MTITPVVFPRELLRICRAADEAYVLQYKATTPPDVLQAWVQKDYDRGEWVRARHDRSQGYRFSVEGQRIRGYLRYQISQGRVEIRKIWIAPHAQGRGHGAALTRALPVGPCAIRIYAGNPRAIRVFRKMGFNLQSQCWFREKGFAQSGILLQRPGSGWGRG